MITFSDSDYDSDCSTDFNNNKYRQHKDDSHELIQKINNVMKDYGINRTFNIQTKCTHEGKNVQMHFISPCCNMKFKCSKCHNEYFERGNDIEKHTIDRKQVMQIVCDICNKVQTISNECIDCHTIFDKYYCGICKLYGSTKDIFHCEFCQMCMYGVKSMYKHCDGCTSCIEKKNYDYHKCLKTKSDGECAICLDLLKNGEKICEAVCGHIFHKRCHSVYFSTQQNCPHCQIK